jgi:hypothetical protein
MSGARIHYPWLALPMLVFSLVGPPVDAASPLSLVRFSRKSPAPADDLNITEKSGPWMILAASFAGQGAEEDARVLARELRKRYRLRAYLHRKAFDFTHTVPGLGLDRTGAQKRMRYHTDGAFQEVAVLVGDYSSIDDPRLRKQLNVIKSAHPESLALESDTDTTLRFAGLRQWQRRLTGAGNDDRGPMAKAFVTRNPLIPREFFAPQGLDDVVIRMNKGRAYSLLDCPGRYTVQVATYRGQVIIDQREIQAIEAGKKFDTRLDEAGDKAERLAELLRKRGVEAYVFHDRNESIVTVGSFDSLGSSRQDGATVFSPAIMRIIRMYAPTTKPLPGPDGQPLAGVQPKALGGLAFDIDPKPVIVPRRSIATDYVASQR